MNELRSRAGTDVIYKHAAAREILRLLRADEVVAIPIDQHAIGTQGTPIPFFGRLAATTTALAIKMIINFLLGLFGVICGIFEDEKKAEGPKPILSFCMIL